MPSALSVAPYNSLNTSFRRATILPLVAVGAAGTVDTTRSANGFTVVAGGSGVYSGVMPTGQRALAWSQVLETAGSASPQFTFNTLDAKAGTWSGVLSNDTTEGDLNADAELWLFFMIEGG